MLNGSAVSVASSNTNKPRFVSASLGVALSISVSTVPVLANEHLSMVDLGLHQQGTIDHSAHLGGGDPGSHFSGDHTSHFVGEHTGHFVGDHANHFVGDHTNHINNFDHHSSLSSDHHSSFNFDNNQGHTGSAGHFSQGDTTHQIHWADNGSGHGGGFFSGHGQGHGRDGNHGGTLVHTPTQDFNLSSSAHDFLASNLAGFHNLTINVGGTTEVVNLHSRLTAAEYVAAEQVLAGNQQTITLSHNGQAVGGTIVLDSNLLSAIDKTVGGTIGSLTITHGVQLIDTVGALSVSGNINNYGSILTASTIAGQTDTISAASIFNAFSGVVDSYFGTGLAGLYSAGAVLNAISSITNYGSMGSSGSLTLSAPTVSNISSGGHVASMSAVQDLNINTAHLTNSGNITSTLGDINVASASNLLVENAAGTMRAADNINLLSNNAALQVMGGNFDSNALNLKAGHSTLNMQADNVSGVVNASADNVHLYTSQSNLNLGNIDSFGDPTLASQGNIIIDGTIAPTNGANLAIVAGQNILSGTGGKLDTRSTAVGGGNGGNLSLIAGANFTVDGSGNVVLTDSANAGKGSATGGIIDLTGGSGGSAPISAITTAGTGATGNAGYVEMVAYKGTGLNSGNIFSPTNVTIDAGAAGGKRGDVSVIIGNPGNGSFMGGITGNKINVTTATPTVGSGMSFDGTGTASSGINSFAATGPVQNEFLQIGGNVSATNDINISAGGLIITGNVSADGSAGQVGGATLDGGAGHNITLNGLQNLSVQGNISAVGGGGAGSGSGTPGLSGGKGGDGGTVTLIKPGSIGGGVTGSINVSGGGGGGGAGGSETAAATQGGAGGLAGTVKVNAGSFSVSGPILEYDGGAGGVGGSSLLGVGAGGGGGSAYGGAGGGGGGGTGNNASDFAAGGGGGYSLVSGAGGGGGGVYGSAGAGTLSFGGNGGSGAGSGTGGAGDVSGVAGAGSIGGLGGGIPGTAPGGAGATVYTNGGAGGQTSVSGQGVGQAGSGAKVVTGHGLVDISGSSGSFKVETGTLKVAGGFPFGSGVTVVDSAGVPLNLLGATLGTGNLNLTTTQNAGTTGADGTVNVLGTVSGQSVSITTNGDAGPNNINILAPFVGGGQFSVVNLTSNGGSITTSGAGSINSLAGTVTATHDVNVTTNTGAPGLSFPFTAISTSGNVTINQGTQTGVFAGSTGAPGGSFTLNAQSPVILGSITTNGGAVSINTTGGDYGITLRGPISTGNTSGSVTIAPSGLGNIIEQAVGSGSAITSNTINLLTNSNIGSASAPVLTNAVNNGTINTTYGSAGNVYLSDSSTGVVTVNAPTASSGTLSVASQASQLNIPQANFTNVSINDNGPVGNVLLNSGNNASAVLGNGSGTFSVSATGYIDANTNNGGIQGTSANLTSTNGSIGSARRLTVTAPTLTAKAANGSVAVTSNASTVNAAGGTSFDLIDTVSGNPLVVNGPIAANNVNIQAGSASNLSINGSLGNASASQVNVSSGGGIALSAGSGVSAASINLNAANNTVNFGSTATATGLNLSTNSGVVSVNAAAPGGTDTINAGGDLAFNGTYSSTNAVTSTVGGALTVGSASNHSAGISGQSLGVNAQSVNNFGNLSGTNGLSVTATGAGGISNSGGTMSGANLTLDTSVANGPINNSGSVTGSGMQLLAGTGTVTNSEGGSITSSDSLAFQAASINNQGTASAQTQLSFANPSGNLSIAGAAGSFATARGANLSFQSPGSITVDGSAGNLFSGANQLGNFTVAAGGNFTSPINNVTLVPDSSGNGGAINIAAADVVYNGVATRTTPFVLSANGGTNPGNRGGSVNLNLFGSAANGIVVGNSVGNFSISATGSDGGQVSIATPGNLTVNTAQMNANAVSSTGNGSTISLSSGNNLLIKGNLDTHNGSGSYGAISLTSGSAQPFLIDGTKTTTTNGQIGIASGQGISGSSVTFNTPGGVSLAQNYVLSGSAGITINGAGLVNNGVVNTSVLSILAAANGFLTTGSTGSYNNLPMLALNLSSTNGNFTISGNAPAANQVNISALNGAVGFGGGSATITAAADANGNGGTITINAKNLASGAASLNAAGTTGNGGTVAVNLTGTSAVKVDSADLSINVANAAGKVGGNVTVANGGDISVDARSLNMGTNFAAGQGANLTLTAGGKLFMNHTNTLPTTLQNLNLTSNSTSSFVLGGASVGGNGIGDSNQSLTAANLSITNLGDGISRGSNSSLNGSYVTLNALGNIGQSNQPIVISAPAMAISSTNGSAYVNLRNVLDTWFLANAAGTVSINSTGSIENGNPINASSLILSANGINSAAQVPVTTNATFVSATAATGGVSVVDTQSAPITLGAISSADFAQVVSDGNIKLTQNFSAPNVAGITSNFGNVELANGAGVSANNVTINAQNGALVSSANFASINGTQSASHNGGSIAVNAGSLTSNTLALNASAGSHGAGGSVNINLTGASQLTVGNNSVSINVANAPGAAGGNVSINNGGNVSVDARYLNMGNNFAAGQGANLSLVSGGNLYLDHTNKLPGGLNNLTLASGSANNFVLGGASLNSNGIGDNNLGLSANNLSITSSGAGIVKGTNSGLTGVNSVSLSAMGDIGQSSAPITVTTPSLNLNSSNGSAYVSLLSPSTDFNANILNTLSILSTGAITTSSPILANSLVLDAYGINQGNQLNISSTNVSVVNRNGSFILSDSQYSPVTLRAFSATGSAHLDSNGDIVTTQPISAGSGMELISTSGGITIGTSVGPSAHQVVLNAQSGAVTFAGGSSSVTATPDSSGNGGSINIIAGTLNAGSLALNAAGTTGAGGSVFVRTSAANPMQIGSGAITANVANARNMAGGSVYFQSGGDLSANSRYINLGSNSPVGQGARLSLLAGGNLFVNNTNLLPSNMAALSLQSNSPNAFLLGGAAPGGNGIAENNRTLSADIVSIVNNGGGVSRGTNAMVRSTSASGAVEIDGYGDIGQSAQPIVVSAPTLYSANFSGNTYFNLRSTPSTTLAALAAGTLSVDSTGSINPIGSLNASNLILNANGINSGNQFTTNAAEMSITTSSGGFSVLNTNYGQTTIDALRAPTTAKVESYGDVVTSQPISSVKDLSLTSDYGSIIVGNGLAASNSITLSTQPNTYGGIVDIDGGAYAAVAKTVNLVTGGGSIGSIDNPFRTAASNLNIDTAGAGFVYVANSNTSSTGTVQLGQANVANFNLTDTNSSATNKGTLVVNGIQSNYGDIVISSNERTMKVNPSVALNTGDDNIVLQNTYAVNGSNQPSIQVGDNASIHGSSFGDPATGNVYLALGAVPTAADVVPGTAPTNGNPQINGTVYFGTTANPTTSIRTNTGDILTGSQRVLSFATNGLASSQISLGKNVTIIADPPVPAGAAAPVLPTLQYVSGAVGSTTAAAAGSVSTVNALNSMNGNTSLLPTASISPASLNVGLQSPSSTANLSALAASIADAVDSSGRGNNSVGANTVGDAPKSKVLTGGVSNLSRKTLEKGALLLAPEQNTVVQTPHGLVSVSAGAVALLVSFEHGLAVYDLHDNHKESVMLLSGNQKISLSPGKNIVLTGKSKEFEDVNPVKFVGYRKLASRALGGECKVYCSEFELLSMVQGLKPLSSLVSSDNPKTRKTMGSLLKTAAILLELGQGGEQFKYYVPRELMALATNKGH